MTWSDPIVDEVRRARDAYAARFHYDLRAIYRDLKEQEKRSGRLLVSYAESSTEVEPKQKLGEERKTPMAVAVECSNGHKRAVSEGSRGRTVACPVAGCTGTVNVPLATKSPGYQTDRLENYDDRHQKVARVIYNTVKRTIGNRADDSPGSYSILATTSDERAAKLVIYQSGLGKERGDDFPLLDAGVYVFVRANDASATRIWTEQMVDVEFPDLFGLMSPAETLGVAPPTGERFTYFRVNTDLTGEELKAHAQRIVDFLVRCSRIA